MDTSETCQKSAEELKVLIEQCPMPMTVWQHYKGGEYMVVGTAIHEATLVPMVLYRQTRRRIRDHIVFARLLSEWHEAVGEGEGVRVPRYQEVKDDN